MNKSYNKNKIQLYPHTRIAVQNIRMTYKAVRTSVVNNRVQQIKLTFKKYKTIQGKIWMTIKIIKVMNKCLQKYRNKNKNSKILII